MASSSSAEAAAPTPTPTTPPRALPLAGRTAIVTGASRGIGRAIAAHLASLGADVVLGYSSSPAQAELLAAELNSSASGRAVPVRADVSDPAAVAALFDGAEAAFGRPAHVLVACAGALSPGYAAYTASKAAVETMIRIMAKELKGTMITANCVAPGPVATELFYAGKSEEAVQRLAAANPMGRIGEPTDIAPVVGFLCSDDAAWVNGQVIRANGGYV
uniref:Short-chain type dehydrogenase/reductase n=1 Tax=Ananas comosus var. bracteatus TaxID=296719 RepID=A0A6V7NMG6_ANACO|nr:unnamed protein product [Ananas comosus var. bracteatus]